MRFIRSPRIDAHAVQICRTSRTRKRESSKTVEANLQSAECDLKGGCIRVIAGEQVCSRKRNRIQRAAGRHTFSPKTKPAAIDDDRE